MGIVWAPMKPKGLSGEKSLGWDPAAEVCLEKVESENKDLNMERHNEVHTDLADEGVIKDEVLVNEVAR